jgi:hypothetical protein
MIDRHLKRLLFLKGLESLPARHHPLLWLVFRDLRKLPEKPVFDRLRKVGAKARKELATVTSSSMFHSRQRMGRMVVALMASAPNVSSTLPENTRISCNFYKTRVKIHSKIN